ncbi:PREDICTED: D-inositol 3-phosphate glycosyltransferase-like [Acropora digitifera]|uniref:D-inositol 3-phosphate glycosyltransferase-like n=1 Tax=Acropora digitifera TaxID=70779 RepID=UPI00077A15C2|nr:PREDICTED: D-inositol 3-phosphate glycosyltransferase-like [Acropora digitifera]
MSSNISQQPLMATFFAYFDAKKRLGSHDNLFLICCPVHRSEDVRQKLEKADLTRSEATSREYLIPRHDKAFVFVSGGIDFARSKDKGDFYLRFDGSMPHMAELEVRLISSEKYCTVEFRDSPDTTENSNLLSTMNLNWSSPSTGGQVSSSSNVSVPPLEEAPEDCSISTSHRKLRVTLLSSEWGSTKGGLSTINRELAIQLAKDENVKVCMYLPCFSDENKRAATDCGVSLLKAKMKPGSEDPIEWLASIPRDHQMDVVIGHGIHLGKQVPYIKESFPECKWVQVVHTDPEELGMFKNSPNPTAKGEKNYHAEVNLCREADLVVAVGPKLADSFSRYLRSKDQEVLDLTPGIFSEFVDINQASEESGPFHVLVFGRGDDEDFKLKGCDIAVRAIAELKNEEPSFKLVFVGAPSGKEEQVKQKLLEEGILARQLIVRTAKEREQLAQQFCEADLVIMPSRTEGFGLIALEALSAGLPVLVSRNSGLGQALKEVPFGKTAVIDSEDPTEWAKKIKAVRSEGREVRLEEAILLREKYARRYPWEGQCRKLVRKMDEIVNS